ncbi:MAG: hypothetical protein E5Y51_05610 [Mesorhizobium sp.]|nr:hypothetical protein EJ078_19680 [Mesorhizobium sp. M1A.F.Ca.IN.022.06.1.1]TIN19678.1 MAG: hypothetical protein E5Y51_05610 [Mesorhizobium sp.]
MPEPSSRTRRVVQTLSRAHDIGQLIRIRCINCNIIRHYLPGDLLKLMGDIPFWDVDMRCERCKRREFDVDILLPSAAEGVKTRVRRLVGVWMVRRVICKDGE